MPKSDRFSQLYPDLGVTNLRGMSLHELYARQELNDRNMKLLASWLNEIDCPVTYNSWVQFDQLRKKLIWAIRLKKLKNYLFSLVSRNQ